MSLKQWKKWPEEIHLEQSQFDRQVRASKQECTPLTLDKENEQAEFLGSQKYYSTLSECTCKDFLVRRTPCKHIYRLAHELGYFKLPEQVTHGDPREVINKRTVIDTVKQLSREAQNILNAIASLDIYNNELFFCSKKDFSDVVLAEIFNTKFIKFDDDISEKLSLIKLSVLRQEIKLLRGVPCGSSKQDVVCNLIKQYSAAATVIADKYLLIGLSDSIREQKHVIFHHTLDPDRPKSYEMVEQCSDKPKG